MRWQLHLVHLADGRRTLEECDGYAHLCSRANGAHPSYDSLQCKRGSAKLRRRVVQDAPQSSDKQQGTPEERCGRDLGSPARVWAGEASVGIAVVVLAQVGANGAERPAASRGALAGVATAEAGDRTAGAVQCTARTVGTRKATRGGGVCGRTIVAMVANAAAGGAAADCAD
eukprot:2090521-Prymnesium_polylepis.5